MRGHFQIGFGGMRKGDMQTRAGANFGVPMPFERTQESFRQLLAPEKASQR